MALYTMIMNYKGGTYALQGHGESLHKAGLKCLKNWDIMGILYEISKQEKRDIIQAVIEDKSKVMIFIP